MKIELVGYYEEDGYFALSMSNPNNGTNISMLRRFNILKDINEYEIHLNEKGHKPEHTARIIELIENAKLGITSTILK